MRVHATPMPTGPTRVVVIGAGISGLSAAWFLRQALGESAEIVVLEKGERIGGALRVSEVAGLPVDEGGEALLARRPEALDLARAVGLEPDIVHPAPVGAGLWSRGRIWPLPAGTVMGVPADPTALAGILTTDEIAAATADASLPGLPIDDDVAIGELVAARMGRAVVDRLVEPLLGGVYAGHADQLSLDATVPSLGAAVREHPSLQNAVRAVQVGGAASPAGPVFAGLVGGVARLPVAVAEASGAIIRTGVTTRELRRVTGGWELVTGP
ncbi:MAG: protoporphyrinogen oxidase, partial [Jiangellaceae bacterium]